MKKVITYGTFDLMHYGHVNLLKRAKKLGDYLIVAVTSNDFDISRGKINAFQSVEERIENVRATGLADKIIIEEYEGQKIDDIKKYGVDVFTVGSDWVGKFDYLKRYCEVVYLDRTEGVSSTDLRSKNEIKIGFIGDYPPMVKYIEECNYVNGLNVMGVVTSNDYVINYCNQKNIVNYDSLDHLLGDIDAVYIVSDPRTHYQQIKKAFLKNKHVLCQSPICMNLDEYNELKNESKQRRLVLMDAIKTNHSLAFNRMCLLLETGVIGDIVSVESTCTVMLEKPIEGWNSICSWGPTALLPALKILGCSPKAVKITSRMDNSYYDSFSIIDLTYEHAIASAKIGIGVKSEGDLVISGTKGYVYVPAPWWKTDYFEIRYENATNNKRCFYELLGEGTRTMLHNFLISILQKSEYKEDFSETIIECVQMFNEGKIIRL
ncbi:MAG: adenylyltransferase/cytidyltransferase family protein [Candidatus Methanomethylophilaceae archaeon]|nr:adenylyltransferase/cytidyltransferase family protein [Candidatus Methanomethylophilaceae archaeon]